MSGQTNELCCLVNPHQLCEKCNKKKCKDHSTICSNCGTICRECAGSMHRCMGLCSTELCGSCVSSTGKTCHTCFEYERLAKEYKRRCIFDSADKDPGYKLSKWTTSFTTSSTSFTGWTTSNTTDFTEYTSGS